MNTLAPGPQEVLSRVFGYDQFRPCQDEAVAGLLGGKDVFALMPTGGGKSLCYQLPSVMMDGCVVVVSPLIALMKDQVDAARANGIRAAGVNSMQSLEARKEAARAYRSGQLDLLYLAPERLAVEGFLDKLRGCPRGRPEAFAIDEAHCLSEWGHDFRPDYLVLSNLREAFPDVPIGAFTATATERVAQDIVSSLALRNPVQVRASFDRKNLFYEVRPKRDLDAQLVEFLRERVGESGIIYRTTRKSVEGTVSLLRRNGIEARGYHAGLEAPERIAAQEAFIHDDCSVMVATIAFGMGIDKPDVRFVVHGDLPKNLESYYQETGRAGRDGEPAHCLLLSSGSDSGRQRYFIEQMTDETERARALGLLQEMERFASLPACRRIGVLNYFGESYHADNCGGCDVCAGHFERTDATEEARLLLAALEETGEKFGAVHVCDVLVGAKTAKVRDKQHDRLSTYGIGRSHAKAFWRQLLDQLLADGFVALGGEGYPVPNITPKGKALCQGKGRVELLLDQRVDPELSTARVAEEPHHPGLFECLRTLRKELADAEEIPPYVVFPDRVLRAMAGRMPNSTTDLAEVPGIGQTRLEKYGDPFLAAIREYLTHHPEAASQRVQPVARIKRERSETCETTFRLLQAGQSPEDIALERELKIGTIYSHLATLIEDGEELDWRKWVPQETEDLLRRLFNELGREALRPIIDASNGAVTFEQAKIMQAIMDCCDSSPLSGEHFNAPAEHFSAPNASENNLTRSINAPQK